MDCSSFSSYQAMLAAGACTIGSGATQLTFSNFTFTGAAAGTGTKPADMTFSTLNGAPATPPSTDTLYGFNFNPNLSVSGVGSESIHITYTITAPSAIIASLHLLVNVATVGGATATVTETDTCGPGTPCTLFAGSTPPAVGSHQDLLGIGPYTTVAVDKDIDVNSSSAIGLASISDVRNAVDLSVVPAPSLSKTFAPSIIAPGGASTLAFTITNNAGVPVVGLAFTDTLPAGVVIAAPNGLTDTCGGTVTATAGSNTISLTGGTVNAPVGTTCSISVNVLGITAGIWNNVTSPLTSTNALSGAPATATLIVALPPTITKAFADSQLELLGPGNSTALTFTITNPNSAIPLPGIALTDTLPPGLIVASPNGRTGSCGGGLITATAGTNNISLSGATLAGGAACTFSVNVTATALGVQDNTTSPITAAGGTIVGLPATASTSVVDLFFQWFFLESGGGGSAHP